MNTESTSTVCPTCKGAKVTIGYACPGFRRVELPCSTCDGQGAVTPAMQDYQARGEKMRADRVGRMVSLREEAQRLGISAVELSHLEQGKVDDWESWLAYLSVKKALS